MPHRLRPHLRSAGVIALALTAALACATAPPPPEFEELPAADVLYQEGLTLLEGRRVLGLFHTVDYTRAIEKFQDVIDNYPYSEQAVLAELAIADAYFAQERYEEALTYYRDFPELHPEHERVPYAIYQAALCHVRRAKPANRDQTATREALQYLDRLISSHPHSPEAAEAQDLWAELRTRLAHHEMQVADFYFGRAEYPSAAERYRGILEEYPGLGLDAEALYRLGLCYTRMRREDEARRIFQVILENYGGSEVARAAADWAPSAQ